MKLRNKQTGEIYDFKITPDYDDVMSGWKIENKDFGVRYYSHLAELNEEWEDYEEPKEHWFIDYDGGIIPFNRNKETATDNLMKQIGNYFETKEEAEKAVETLKAWKRLKDKGFSFDPVDRYEALCGNGFSIPITATMPPEAYTDTEVSKDLDLLFCMEDN